jgi:hypothetical protein
MPLEFALRPRLRLDRPDPPRRLQRIRLPPLTLPVIAYWLAIAGLTHALVSALGEHPAKDRTAARVADVSEEPAAEEPLANAPPGDEPPDEASTSHEPVSDALPPVPTLPAVTPPPPVPDLAAAAVAAPFQEPVAAAPRREVAPRRDVASRHEPATRRERARQQPPVHEFRAPEPPAPFAWADEPAPWTRKAPATATATSEPVPAPLPATSLPSCESAAASANETLDMRAARGAPDLSREALAAVLENGAYLARCDVPAGTALDICAAVQDGKVVGVTVSSAPRNPAINACVRRAVAALRFPSSARLDTTRTRFDAAR